VELIFEAMVDQIRAVDISRICPDRLATLSSEELKELGKALAFVVGMKTL